MAIKSELKKWITICRNEINSLKSRLNEIGAKKSELIKKKREYTANIDSLIEKIKSLSNDQKNFLEEIKESVNNKEQLYKELNSKTPALKGLNDNIAVLRKKNDVRLSSAEIQKRIEELEFKLQTDVMPFEREIGINKHIKKLKADIIKAKKLEGVLPEKSNLISEIKELKNRIKVSTNNLLANKNNLSGLRENKANLLSDIRKLKNEREQINIQLKEINSVFLGIDAQLKERLLHLSTLSLKLRGIFADEKNRKLEAVERITKEKQELAREKIRRGEKLTNEDLLAFQDKYCKEQEIL